MNRREGQSCGSGDLLYRIRLSIIPILCFLVFSSVSPLLAQKPASDASTKEKLDMIKEALKSGEDINEKDPEGKTPLMGAAEDGDVAVVKYMLEHGARVNDRSETGVTALTLALVHAHSGVVKYLLEHGADLNPTLAVLKGSTMSPFGKHVMWTSFCLLEPDALSLAFSKGLTDSDGEYIWSQSVGVLRNVRCTAGALKLFLDRGADPNKVVGEGTTPLTSAAGAGRLDVVQFLVQKGANVNAPNKFGITPLKAAGNAQKDREKIIEVLRKAGARE